MVAGNVIDLVTPCRFKFPVTVCEAPLISAGVYFGGLEGYLRIFSNVKEIRGLQVLGQLGIVCLQGCGFDSDIHATLSG